MFARSIFLLLLLATPAWTGPDTVLEFHDPSIVKAHGAYYVFSTGPGIRVRRSKDLETWEDLGSVFKAVPRWAQEVVPDQPDLWAPDVAFFEGRYHLYYAISRFGTNQSAIGLATSRSLDPRRSDYGWVDRGIVIRSRPGADAWNAIDAHVAFDSEERPWLFWGSFHSGIKAAQLDPKTGKLARDAKFLPIASRPHPGAVEAPYIVRRGEYFYLFLSFDYCCRGADSDYRMVVGRADRLEGPYVDRQGRALLDGGGTPVLSGYGRWKGPGHNSVLLREEGDLLVHHAYDAQDGGKPRLRLSPLLWMEDGWPVAGDAEDRARWLEGGEPPSPAGAWMHSADFAAPTRLVIHADGALGATSSANRWEQEGRRLTLRWPRGDAPGGVWIDSCILSVDGCRYVGRNQLGMIVRGWRLADDIGGVR